jgi:hypothetical protein
MQTGSVVNANAAQKTMRNERCCLSLSAYYYGIIMKRLLYASIFATTAALGLSSCIRADYDADPKTVSNGVNPLTQTNNNNGGGNNGGNNNSFNWSGTDPMSAKIDGAAWQATAGEYQTPSGFPVTVEAAADDGSFMRINIPTNATLNTVYTFSNNLTGSYAGPGAVGDPDQIYNAGQGGSGQIMITEEDASHIKGKFTFTGKNFSGKGTKTITEGYFNVNK